MLSSKDFFGSIYLPHIPGRAQFTEDVDAEGKTAVITGANSGIGMQTARELNLKGATVYMLCRDYERAFSSRIKLTQLGCDPSRLIIKVVDLASFASIRESARELRNELSVIDILVNNAGIMAYPKYELTVDGYEVTWQTNYLGHFLFTELLLPLVERSANGRIINVSSSLHKRADSVDFFVVNDPRNFGRNKSYCRSKLAQVMHARELSRRIRVTNPSSNITVNSMHPGLCATNLGRYSLLMKTPFRQIFKLPIWFFTKTALSRVLQDGAQTVLFLSLSRSVQSVSGSYFGECAEQEPSPKALDDDLCNILYNYSIEGGQQFSENVSAKEKIALITGANSGHGLQLTRELNLRGATVYMLCRSSERAQEARSTLTKLGCDPTRLIVKLIDLADFSTVKKFAEEIKKEVTHIDILVNNAAVMSHEKFERTIDGYEFIWQSNYLGHFLLTELLLPLLTESKNGRIINVSARLHHMADSVKISIVNDPKKFRFLLPYARSKLAQIMHARELTRRLRASNPAGTVTINALHPGVAATNIIKTTIFGKTPLRQIITVFGWFFTKTDRDLAQTALFLCLSKSVESVSGRYFKDMKEMQPSANALDDEASNLLYLESSEAIKS
ncbi:unnamed protein product [Enterobius vermicularis]|uniref:Short-chain dehydrogenase n=1 Tax=Enterobius vermicularis TaxID=51028 RepID=A0A0N4V1G7_ENTVE|nr:unnamed protein product [Enterobius vermicularis]